MKASSRCYFYVIIPVIDGYSWANIFAWAKSMMDLHNRTKFALKSIDSSVVCSRWDSRALTSNSSRNTAYLCISSLGFCGQKKQQRRKRYVHSICANVLQRWFQAWGIYLSTFQRRICNRSNSATKFTSPTLQISCLWAINHFVVHKSHYIII